MVERRRGGGGGGKETIQQCCGKGGRRREEMRVELEGEREGIRVREGRGKDEKDERHMIN